ncbi:adenylyltransferase and sulfurtransferase uba4 [Coleophoma crateriformis]|uniref:Adenylyltransferase and sulfurtransferase uba4 n=1 Tax=Coleophoma crateriformis TaxID=565419 RepID=A0A3D8R3N5_9HELO|nr:adenylyltransferase and sulfurtransferase uba4 [Coleophoma crateriformis]
MSADALRKQIAATEEQLKSLRAQLHDAETRNTADEITSHDQLPESQWPLSQDEYKRYGRQMIVPNVGIQGQLRLKNAAVLIVGAGGLGCPAAAYLSGAGVGRLGLVDGDVVEMSNLHRQILHSTSKMGMKKVDSAIAYLRAINPEITYQAHPSHLTPQTAEEIVSQYDLVLDCTDHPTSRYLISDICVLLQKPLVSASALRTDGQLLVLNSPSRLPGTEGGGPCYRCVFPKPPPAESVVSCGDGGILGPVVGVMGVLQALEAVNLITAGKLEPMFAKDGKQDTSASMLLFSSTSSPPFRSIKLRSSRRPKCYACSGEPGTLSLNSLTSGSLDYVMFCGITHPVELLGPEERISAEVYRDVVLGEKRRHLLLDVREKIQFDIAALPNAVNIPFSKIQSSKPVGDAKAEWISLLEDEEQKLREGSEDMASLPIYVVCRLGNDSQVVARKLKEVCLKGTGNETQKDRWIGDVKGGYRAWREKVDNQWPEY